MKYFLNCIRNWNWNYIKRNPKLGNKKSWGGRWASWCVRGMFETNPKLANKPKSRKKKSWGERQASWCVWGMLGCDQSMKTQNSTTNRKLGNTKLWGERQASWWNQSIKIKNSFKGYRRISTWKLPMAEIHLNVCQMVACD